MSFFGSLYEEGLGLAGKAAVDGRSTPTTALASVRAMDREVERLHRDMQRHAAPPFWSVWVPKYNEWLVYRTVDAPREAAANPDTVLENVRRYGDRIFYFRAGLDRECTRLAASRAHIGGVPGAPKAKGTWKPIAIAAGVLGAAAVGHHVWKVYRLGREKTEAERHEADQAEMIARAQAALGIAPASTMAMAPQPVVYAMPGPQPVVYAPAPPPYVTMRPGP